MSKPQGTDAWWDNSWNPVGGCKAISPGCMNCYAAQCAGTYTFKWLHQDVTTRRGTKRIFNGTLTEAPSWHRLWSWPLRWVGAKHPKLGLGQPSLIFVADMSDLFHEGHPTDVISRVCATLALSEHIGQLLTKRTRRMSEYFSAQSPRTVRRWQQNLWLGFSAERQQYFDARWADMRVLAEAGWVIFVSVAPLIGPVRLPPDFLSLGKQAWVIVAGEQGKHKGCRDDPNWANWARLIRDQCAAAGIPFFMKQMPKKKPIPPDLLWRQFPALEITKTKLASQRPQNSSGQEIAARVK